MSAVLPLFQADYKRTRWREAAGRAERRQQVLIIDDRLADIAVTSAAIDDLCRPLSACYGEDALRLALERQPDLILLDVRLSDVDGFEVCRRLKCNPATASIPVIFLTASLNAADEVRGLSLGAIDYIAKSVDAAVLRARVRNHLLLQRQRLLLERQSQLDALTGIANRRVFDNILEHEWQRLRHLGQPLAVLLIDVDFFKIYNDSFGHQAGDEALRTIAGAIDECVQRQGDLVARYGGEEFACILPQTDLQGMRTIAGNVQAAIAELAIPHSIASGASRITVSIGGAVGIPDEELGYHELVSMADRHLYEAKQAGRNGVVCA